LSSFSALALVIGVVALAIGAWLARWPVSDRMLRDVVADIESQTGETPPAAEVRVSMKRQRQRTGLIIGAVGGILIAIALGSM
jgi:hypothetical protein